MEFEVEVGICTCKEKGVQYGEYGDGRIWRMVGEGEEKGQEGKVEKGDLCEIEWEKEQDVVKMIGRLGEVVGEGGEKGIGEGVRKYIQELG